MTDNTGNNNAIELDIASGKKKEESLLNAKSEPEIKVNTLPSQEGNTKEVEEIISKENDNDNYFISTFAKNKKVNIIITSCIIVVIICEFFFGEPLFELSLDAERNIQWGLTEPIFKFFNFITTFGGELFMGLGCAIVLLFFPLIKTIVYIYSMIFSIYLHSIMKIWYGNPRPFWKAEELYKDECDGGFGNPSGHSYISMVIYLSLCHYIIQSTIRFKISSIAKIVLYFLFSIWIGLVMFSRIVLGVHSINQIIYGGCLGIWQFLVVLIIFKADEMPLKYYRKLLKEKKYIIINVSIIIIMIIIAIFSSLIFNRNYNYDELNEELNKHCSHLPPHRRFNKDGLFGSSLIIMLLGIYLGQFTFWNIIDKRYKKNSNGGVALSSEIENPQEKRKSEVIDSLINNWNKNYDEICKKFYNIFIILFSLTICFSPILLYLLIPSDINIVLVFIFKLFLPFFVSVYLTFSYGLYITISLACGNSDSLLNNVQKKYNNNKN